MARTDITVQALDENAANQITYEAANVDGNAFANSGRELIHVKNDSAGSVTVTLVTGATVAGLAVADLAVAIPAGEERLFGKLATGTFNQKSGADKGKTYVDYSAVASVTVAVVRP